MSANSRGQHELDVPSTDVLHLLLAHLTESGLHGTASSLRSESGVGMPGLTAESKASAVAACGSGDWAAVLEALDSLDYDRVRRCHAEDAAAAGDGEEEDGGGSGGRDGAAISPLDRAAAQVRLVPFARPFGRASSRSRPKPEGATDLWKSGAES